MGGYKNLLVYQQAVVIFDLNHLFCERYIDKRSRTFDQMIQADRSGKQNIVEGSLEKSLKSNIYLTGISRASYGELLEDYIDFLQLKGLKPWSKEDQRVLEIRKTRITNETNLSNWSNWTNSSEPFANLMITLLSRENYLLDQMLRSLERKFVEEGGYTENLYKKRMEYRKKKFD